jgi:membrane protein YqaA with SNARE-associated domain
MTITKAILTVVICMAIGALIGGSVGFLIGYFTPHALAMQFRLGNNFDPVQVGVGVGIPQGLMLGAAVGVVLVAIMSWREVRMQARPNPYL